MSIINKEQMIKKQKEEKHVCIRIFEDDTVIITDQDGNLRLPIKNPKPLVGPSHIYHQALWYNGSPTCIWYGGKQY